MKQDTSGGMARNNAQKLHAPSTTKVAICVEREACMPDVISLMQNDKWAPVYLSDLGALFQGDALTILPSIKADCVDTVFADPPFNIGKDYGSTVNDRMKDGEYL